MRPCSVRSRSIRDPTDALCPPAIEAAEASGLASPALCSYAFADLGVLVADKSSPIGGLPAPDLFYACDSQCAVVARWGDEVQRFFAERTRARASRIMSCMRPPLTRAATHSPAELAGFRAQIEAMSPISRSGWRVRYDEARLAEVVSESAKANRLWQRCLETARHRPSPWTSFDAFTSMAPIVIARGTRRVHRLLRPPAR
jgi:benzoyl-CoA reductase/2-hydroxyglutaryl-CoA dehydratase subunit BcrC/BadD/HgdB